VVSGQKQEPKCLQAYISIRYQTFLLSIGRAGMKAVMPLNDEEMDALVCVFADVLVAVYE
jgi:hypothetical protein